METFLLIFAAILITCLLFDKMTGKFGTPSLLAFIIVGMLFGEDGIFKIEFSDFDFAGNAATFALIFIMFYGGYDTNWKTAKPVCGKAVMLSTLGVVMTAGFTGAILHYVMGVDWIFSMLVGSVLGSTDAASVFSILKSRRLNLKHGTAPLLEMESGSNDPAAYMVTIIFLSVIQGDANLNVPLLLAKQIVFGVVFGVGIALCGIWLMRRISFNSSDLSMVFVLALALLSYSLPAALDGNGFLSAYLAGIILGQSNHHKQKELSYFFNGMVSLMQISLFFLLGLLATPSQLPHLIPEALVTFLVLTLIARPLTLILLLKPFHHPWNQIGLLSWAGLRGASSIVFAIMAMLSLTGQSENDIFHLVFMVVILSVIFQGMLLPWASRKFNMIDDNQDVRLTFNDYTHKARVQFLQFEVKPNHSWAGRKIRDIIFPPDTLLVLIQRPEENPTGVGERHQDIVPNGETVIESGDKLILTGRAMSGIDGITLDEQPVRAADNNKLLPQYAAEHNGKFIILISRGDEVLIPSGSTRLKTGDRLVTFNR